MRRLEHIGPLEGLQHGTTVKGLPEAYVHRVEHMVLIVHGIGELGVGLPMNLSLSLTLIGEHGEDKMEKRMRLMEETLTLTLSLTLSFMLSLILMEGNAL